MDLKKLKAFIKLAKEEGVASLSYENDDTSYSVKFASAVSTVTHLAQPEVAVQAKSENKAASNDDFYAITSPFVGTFYASSAPDAPPYVKVGDKIRKGQTLCIVEAMKIMNEIESDVDGEIVEICLDNESYAEFGEVLFKVAKK